MTAYKDKHNRTFQAIMVTLGLFTATGTALAKGEIRSVETLSTPAIPSSYFVDGTAYRWGVGMNLRLKSFQYQGRTFAYNPVTPDSIHAIRADNANADGEPCAVYAETAGAPYSYQATLPGNDNGIPTCAIAEIIADNVINIGALDVFSNSGPRDYALKNIERIDLVFSNGIIAPADELNLSGHTVMEKNGNNTIQIAAILELDDSGQPAAYGPLIKVNANSFADSQEIQYGLTNVITHNDFLSNESKAPQGFMVWRESLPETQGFAFVSLEDLGISAGQKYYGISAFAADVDASRHNLLDPATFPQNTAAGKDGDDADFHLGTAGNLTLGTPNRPPVAKPDEAIALTGIPLTIKVLSNDSDPDNDPLEISIDTPPGHGTATVTPEGILYTSLEGFTGDDFLVYRVADGNGGTTTAVARITVNPIPKAVAGDGLPAAPIPQPKIIETGLEGHGAGSLGWLLLPAGGLALYRRKQPKGMPK
jgi:hypothetical protein